MVGQIPERMENDAKNMKASKFSGGEHTDQRLRNETPILDEHVILGGPESYALSPSGHYLIANVEFDIIRGRTTFIPFYPILQA